jgi:CheY-like chemotaxis protein
MWQILVAEDNSDDRFFIQRALDSLKEHVKIHFVEDGEEAIHYLSGRGFYCDRKNHPLPDLISLDIRMPRRDGLDTLSWIRKQPEFHKTPVVIMSSSNEPKDVSAACGLGVTHYVMKPIHIEEWKTVLVDIFRLIFGLHVL